ncbi:hypothetical protein Q8F55_007513 [Vanrija albida]|uniref:Anaphase-promoting complex subunit 4 WD40 domain-containing protein n=1 Tax=Vanrija albida TaxID=181172 RepID=A0ABR3PTR3_9TREE
MELYIPPPTSYLPRLPPPRPVLPTVPVVPPPDLPDVLTAPEGAYTLTKGIFPDVELPGPLPMDIGRPGGLPVSSGAIIGAGGFGMSSPGFVPMPTLSSPNIFAVSSGATLVNGQWQPGHATRVNFADVWYPARVAGKDGGFGALVRLGLGKKAAETPQPQNSEAPPQLYDNEDEYSDSDTEMSSDDGPMPAAMHDSIVTPNAPNPNAPAASNAKGKGGFGKSGSNNKKQDKDKSLSNARGGIITRVSPNLQLSSIMDEKGKNGGERVRWAFWNMGRLFCWAEEGGVTENLASVVFQVPPTAHAISQLTVGPERQDIVVGLETGDLVHLDFINDRTERFNVGGKLIKSAVTGVHFDPRGGDRFVASFADNSVAQFCLFAEEPTDAAWAVVSALPRPWTNFFDAEIAAAARARSPGSGSQAPSSAPNGDSHHDREQFLDKLLIWKNADWNLPADKKVADKPWAGKNPMAVYRLGCDTELTAMAYSPDGRWLAVTAKDGLLRLIDNEEERVTDVFEPYFGSLNCVAWSPDSRFVAVGGQDDLVTVYSARESRLVARCQGHTGFVTCIAFDPTRRSEGRGYRFGSVGEDGKLLLWDFSAAALRKPRHHHSNSSHFRVHGAGSTASLTRSGTIIPVEPDGAFYHKSPPKSEVAMLQPVLARVVEGNLMTSLHMGPKTIATVSRAGSFKFWSRPPRVPRAKRTTKAGKDDKKREHA